MSKHSKAIEAVSGTLYYESLEIRKELYLREGSIYYEFMDELQKMGFEFEDRNAIDANRICINNPLETRDLVIKYYKKSIIKYEKEELMSNLHNKANKAIIPFFIEEFYKADNYLVSTVGNCLMITADKEYTKEYIKMLSSKELFTSDYNIVLFYVLAIVSKLKISGINHVLIDLLKFNNSRYHVLNALSKYKDSSLISIFEKYLNDSNRAVKKLALKAITDIEKKK